MTVLWPKDKEIEDLDKYNLDLYDSLFGGDKASEFKPGQSLPGIKKEYQSALEDIMLDYLTEPSARPITAFRNVYRRAVNDALTQSFYSGWGDSPAGVEIPDSAVDWLVGRIEAEVGYADSVWSDLKGMRADMAPDEVADWIASRAENYTSSLDGIYDESKVRGALEQPLTFGGEDGEETCATCQGLKGETHPASWWVESGLIPGQSGNENFECKGYRCQHVLLDAEGNVYTSEAALAVGRELWYRTLFEGSSTSGNYGHDGVPGQHGGSASGGGFSNIGVSKGASKSEINLASANLRQFKQEQKDEMKRQAKLEKERQGIPKGDTKGVSKGVVKASPPNGQEQWTIVNMPRSDWPVEEELLDAVDHEFSDKSPSEVKDAIVKGVSGRSGLDYKTCNQLVRTWADTSNDSSPISLNLQLAATQTFGHELSEWQQERYDSTSKLAGMSKEWLELGRQIHDPNTPREEIGALYDRRKIVEDEFGALSESLETHSYIETLSGEWDAAQGMLDDGTYDKFTTGVYQETQDFLKSEGYSPDDEIILYRGIAVDTGKVPPEGDVIEYQGNALESWTIRPSIAYSFGNVVLSVKVPASSIFSSALSGPGCLAEREFIIFGGQIPVFVAQGAGP